MSYILLIDTATEEAHVALARDVNIMASHTWKNGRGTGTKLLAGIEEMLSAHNITLKDVTRVAVHSGPGHYSAIRTGIVTASLIGLAQDVEIVEVSGGSMEDMVSQAVITQAVSVVTPKYL